MKLSFFAILALALGAPAFGQPLDGKPSPMRGPRASRGRPAMTLPTADPASVGMDAGRLDRIGEVVSKAVEDGDVPGAVVLVARRGKVVYRQAFGLRQVEPERLPMGVGTAFDMASLTKPVATATSIMILIENSTIRPDDRLGRLLPAFNNHGKGAITIEQLLRHRSGLIADNPIDDYSDYETAWERLANLDLEYEPGSKFLYSDVNYIILGRVVEHYSGSGLPSFARDKIFLPLEMDDTRFGFDPDDPDDDELLRSAAPTERDVPPGVVHDPRSRALGGYAGHAGLFSTADDLAIYAQMLLNGGVGPNGARILSPLAVRLMTTPGDTPAGQRRGLGWDIDTGFSSPRGALFGSESFGHTGFTGTSLWIDPETETFVILLTSRLHPGGDKPSPIPLRRAVATIAASAIMDLSGSSSGWLGSSRPQSAPGEGADQAGVGTTPATRTRTIPPATVKCGIDVLAADDYRALKGHKVGLVTNHTGRLAGTGQTTVVALWNNTIRADNPYELVAIYSPEHGIAGRLDSKVGDAIDEATGLPIFSLYGDSRKPTPESLEGVDLLVYDIQDVGARFYTYISTLGLVLEAGAEYGIPVVVLDRPNPIGGVEVSGPVRDDDLESFIAYHKLPVRHGMTVGELAKMFNAERAIGADLTVIACEGWERAEFYDETGLLWINPSPNMRSPAEALLYPGVGLLEATNLATGRGTDTPFERIGAPYITPEPFAGVLNAAGLAGVRFTPVYFTPTERQFAGEQCGGVFIEVVDRSTFDPIALGIELAVTLRHLYPGTWEPGAVMRLHCDRASFDAILAGKSRSEVIATWQAELAEFRDRRERFLIYR